MSAGRRFALIAATVVLLAGGFVLARGASDDEGSTAQTPVATTTQAPPAGDAPAETAPAPPPPRVERIRMRDGAPAGEARTLVYEDGETVRLRFTSNVADEVHIHGVDRYVDVAPGETASTRFKADGQGIFEIESHTTGTLLAKLEVRP
jgi:FtsP/CotA-like multicopper oxidase with cupredoxin domain